jgi:hypothetical protein
VQFIDDFFPLVVFVTPLRWDDGSIDQMNAGYERYFQRKERYAILSHSPKGAETSSRDRKRITDWANSPRVRDMSSRYCVGTATIVPNALARGALTAILWVWQPTTPLHMVATPDEGLDWCLRKLADARVPMKEPPASVRDKLLPRLNAL